jgi:regulator of sigma E protease
LCVIKRIKIKNGYIYQAFSIFIELIITYYSRIRHFIPAKLFKTRVEKFYFFDVKYSLIKRKKIGEIEYGMVGCLAVMWKFPE